MAGYFQPFTQRQKPIETIEPQPVRQVVSKSAGPQTFEEKLAEAEFSLASLKNAVVQLSKVVVSFQRQNGATVSPELVEIAKSAIVWRNPMDQQATVQKSVAKKSSGDPKNDCFDFPDFSLPQEVSKSAAVDDENDSRNDCLTSILPAQLGFLTNH